MKSIEEQIEGKCIHFNGMQNDTCKCGINYKEAFGERPILRMPCIKESARMAYLPDELIPCEKLQFPTPEEVKKQIDDGNKSIALTLNALGAVQKHIKSTGLMNGKIKCPNGDHKLAYTKSDYNGHIWMKCNDCDISMMQ